MMMRKSQKKERKRRRRRLRKLPTNGNYSTSKSHFGPEIQRKSPRKSTPLSTRLSAMIGKSTSLSSTSPSKVN